MDVSRTSRTPIVESIARLARVDVPDGDARTAVILASVVFFLLAEQFATGVLLALYYRPSLSEAHDSVRFVITAVDSGALIRALHVWGARALLVVLGATMTWMVVRRMYRSPHGPLWTWTSVLTLTVVADFFTGGLLPWTNASAIDWQVASSFVASLPIAGPSLQAFIFGGSDPGVLALVRMLGLHAGALPMFASVCVAILVLHGSGSALAHGRAGGSPLYPHILLRCVEACCVTAICVVLLASFSPTALGTSFHRAGDPSVGTTPAWYLAFVHEMLTRAPSRMLGLPSAPVIASACVVIALALVAFPALDRKASRLGQILALVVLTAVFAGGIRALFV